MSQTYTLRDSFILPPNSSLQIHLSQKTTHTKIKFISRPTSHPLRAPKHLCI